MTPRDAASLLDDTCDRFEAAWREAGVADLRQALADSGWDRAANDQALAEELVCIDLEHRWRQAPGSETAAFDPSDTLGACPTADDYTRLLYGKSDRPTPILWVLAEWNARTAAGVGDPSVALRERYAGRPDVLKAINEAARDAPTQIGVRRKTRSGSRGFELRCPQCHQATTIVVDSDLTDIVCEACGCAFDLVDQNQETHAAQTLTRLGSFELIERLGFGGFGTVWKARDTQLDRTVAVKVPRRGALTREETEMFLREARSAAQLRHPNIVSVHEVGVADSAPFLVTDYIRGVSLSDQLTTGQLVSGREAATLVRKLALAIEHAHEHGVIHRDIKPANVMIDDDGEPHVMDFGLAKRSVADVTMTMQGQVLGTPAYMSPEQARGDADRADARSDVYSLGAVLFELLTGGTPFRGSVQMLIKQVIEVEAPSARSLNRSVPFDLDTVCSKCLEKEPAQRYRSAQALADDLGCFLEGRPIAARPVGPIGQRWRWCKRNPLLAGLGAAVASLLIGVAAVTSIAYLQTAEALRQKEVSSRTAEEVSKFLVDLFGSVDSISSAIDGEKGFFTSDPSNANITARELLDRGAERITSTLGDQPATKLALQETMGDAYFGLGLFQRAAEQFQLARELVDESKESGVFSRLTHKQGVAALMGGDYPESDALLNAALERRTRDLGRESLEVSSTLISLGMLYSVTGDKGAEAEALMKEGIEIRTRLRGPRDPSVAFGLSALASYQLSTDADEAKATIMRALAITSGNRSGDWEQFGDIIGSFQQGLIDFDEERFDEAEEKFRIACEGVEKLLGPSHPFLSFGLFELARTLDALGRSAEAIEYATRAIEVAGETVKPTHPKYMDARRTLADAYSREGEHELAIDMIAGALADAPGTYGPESADHAQVVGERATVLSRAGRHEEAIASAERSLALLEAVPGGCGPKQAAAIRREAAACLNRAGQFKAAIAALEGGSPEQVNNLDTLELLAEIQLASGDLEGVRETAAAAEAAGGRTGRHAPGWVARFDLFEAKALAKSGQRDEAAALAERALIVLDAIYDEDDDWVREAQLVVEGLKSETTELDAAQSSAAPAPSPPATVEAAR